nr:hypothetical protein [Anaerolineae bacterium]
MTAASPKSLPVLPKPLLVGFCALTLTGSAYFFHNSAATAAPYTLPLILLLLAVVGIGLLLQQVPLPFKVGWRVTPDVPTTSTTQSIRTDRLLAGLG